MTDPDAARVAGPLAPNSTTGKAFDQPSGKLPSRRLPKTPRDSDFLFLIQTILPPQTTVSEQMTTTVDLTGRVPATIRRPTPSDLHREPLGEASCQRRHEASPKGRNSQTLSGRFRQWQWASRQFGRPSSRLDPFPGEMPEDPGDDPMFQDDADDSHLTATVRTDQRVHLVDSSNKTRPRSSPSPPPAIGEPVVFPVSRMSRCQRLLFPFLPPTSCNVRIVAQIAHEMNFRRRDVCNHSCEKVEGVNPFLPG